MSKKCPFRLANPFNPADGSWYWVTDTTYGGSFTEATGNGTTDDRAAIQSCLNAAASAGKNVYFPAGTYKVIPSGGSGLILPSGVTLRGVGDTSVISIYDDGTDDGNRGLSIDGKSNIALRYLKLTGTVTAGASYPSQYPSVQMILVDEGVSGLTLDHVTFDKCEYALRFVDDPASASSNITVTNCTTGSSVMNPFFLSRLNGFAMSDCTLAAATVGQQSGRWPHHFYFATNVTNATISRCILSGGQHACIDVIGPASYITFEDLTLSDIYQGIVIEPSGSHVTFSGITASTTRMGEENSYWLMLYTTADYVTLEDFAITGDPSVSDYLIHCYALSGCHNVVQNGSMTSCAYLGNTPPGCVKESGGGAPTYTNVSLQ